MTWKRWEGWAGMKGVMVVELRHLIRGSDTHGLAPKRQKLCNVTIRI